MCHPPCTKSEAMNLQPRILETTCTKSQYMSGFCTRRDPMCTTCLCVPGFAPPSGSGPGPSFWCPRFCLPRGGRGPGFSRKFVRLVLLLRQNLATCVIFPRPVETKPQTQPLVTAILPVAPAGSGRLPWLCPGGLPAWACFLCVGRLARLRSYVHIAQPC